MVEMIVPCKSIETVEMVPDYVKADFYQIREKLSEVNWPEQLNDFDTTSSWNLFKETIQTTVDTQEKMKKPSGCNVMQVIRKKKRLWKRYSTSHDYQSYIAYKQVQNETKSAVRKAKRDLERKLAADVKKNAKAFYRYMNSRCKVRSKVGP